MLGRFFSKQLAFFRRNWIVDSSYKLAFALELVSAVVPVLAFYFISRLVESREGDALSHYGGTYFEFVLIGLGLTQYFNKALTSFSEHIRRAQTTGVMEAVLSTQTSPVALVLYDATYSFVMASFHFAVIIALGAFALGADFSHANIASVIAALALSLGAFGGLGIISAAVLVVLKKGDPVAYIFGLGASLVSGALFPKELLPDWLHLASYALPMTHGLEALRLALFRGYGIDQLSQPFITLGAMTAILLPTSLWLFKKVVDRARRDGTLLQY